MPTLTGNIRAGSDLEMVEREASLTPQTILHLAAGNMYGGIESMLVTLARHQAFCPSMLPEFAFCFRGRFSEELASEGVPVHQLGEVRFSRPWTVWSARRRLQQLLRERRFDVVIGHAPWPYALGAGTVRQAGLPLVFWAHAAPVPDHWIERRAKKYRPDLVIANSRHTQSAIGGLFPGTPTKLLHCPVPAPVHQTSRQSSADIRRELAASNDDVIIVMAARLDEFKGHHILLEGLKGLATKRPWRCWIVGGAQRPEELDLLNRLKQLTARYGLSGRVSWLGERADVAKLLGAADIYCQPNVRPEPFGIAFVEALYAGLPVVTSAMGGALEIVDETCGLLVPPNEPDRLAATLALLIDDEPLRRRLGEAGPRRARELCSPEVQLPRLHQMLNQAIAKSVA